MRFVKNSKLEKGDIIRVKRSKGYYHYGIAKSEDEVIHFTGPVNDSINDTKNIQIRLTTLDLFLRGDVLEVLRPYSSIYTPETVIERAMSFIGQSEFLGKSYNLVTNNCEHFANYVYFNKKDSKQVEIVTDVALASAVVLGLVGTATALTINKIRKRKK
jgi:hypothetical protein